MVRKVLLIVATANIKYNQMQLLRAFVLVGITVW